MNVPKPLVLIVLDGWGIAPDGPGNPISQANIPFYKKLWYRYPRSKLLASGEAVGLPKGEAGNSEVGHINLGAGFVVFQDLFRINRAIADGSFFKNEALLSAISHVKENNSSLHLLGLISSAVVHSNLEHLFSLIRLCKENNLTRVFIHAFTDGRDSSPTSAQIYLSELEHFCQNIGVGEIASICGRYFAMDRDHRWERTKRAYDLLTLGVGRRYGSYLAAVSDSYKRGTTDEFAEPVVLVGEDDQPKGLIKDFDATVFFNFRNDRPRQLSQSFVLPNFEGFERKKRINNLFFVTLTSYEKNLPVSAVAFEPTDVEVPVAKVLAERGLRQLHLAESEKFPHVTYFFNGGREDPFVGEDRIEIPSPKVATYDKKPEMSALPITDVLLERVLEKLYDFILVNFANADMVAHTGVLTAGIKSAEIIDQVLARVVPNVLNRGGAILLTADHGNLEVMIDPDTGGTDTEHNIGPVPFIYINDRFEAKELNMGILADVAPTILDILGVEKPYTMTARNLLE